MSDVIIGLITRNFTVINRTTIKSIGNQLTDFQKQSLWLFAKITFKSQKVFNVCTFY